MNISLATHKLQYGAEEICTNLAPSFRYSQKKSNKPVVFYPPPDCLDGDLPATLKLTAATPIVPFFLFPSCDQVLIPSYLPRDLTLSTIHYLYPLARLSCFFHPISFTGFSWQPFKHSQLSPILKQENENPDAPLPTILHLIFPFTARLPNRMGSASSSSYTHQSPLSCAWEGLKISTCFKIKTYTPLQTENTDFVFAQMVPNMQYRCLLSTILVPQLVLNAFSFHILHGPVTLKCHT